MGKVGIDGGRTRTRVRGHGVATRHLVLLASFSLLVALCAPVRAVALSSPTIVTTATGSGPLPGSIGDTALLKGGSGATGTITFTVYGPNDAICAGSPAFTSSPVTVAGDGSYPSDTFFPTTPGTYEFVASYSGDANNAPFTTMCGDVGESVTMTAARPTLVTTATGSGPAGSQVSDAALLSNGSNETGTIAFTLYGPTDPTCTGTPVFSAPPVKVSFDGRYSSGPFTPSAAGTYRFIARYSGDPSNTPVATACGDAGESVTIGAPPLTLTSIASASVIIGGQISDTATLSGAGNPTGTITFRLFGPDDATCTSPAIAASTSQVSGTGKYVSNPFTVTLSGVYRFVAGYSGDQSNGSISTACGDPSEAVTATNPPPPVLAESFVVTPVSGRVSVELPASTTAGAARISGKGVGFVPLNTARNLPVGSSVDVTKGSARLTTAADTKGHVQSGDLSFAQFTVLQARRERGLTELDLTVSAAARKSCTATTARAALRRKLPPTVLALLRAKVNGRFRTRGRYSSATVRGTSFDTIDRCDGTLTRVRRGVVVVADFRRHVNIVVRAGKHYLASSRATH